MKVGKMVRARRGGERERERVVVTFETFEKRRNILDYDEGIFQKERERDAETQPLNSARAKEGGSFAGG